MSNRRPSIAAKNVSARTVRLVSLGALVAYPLGATVVRWGESGFTSLAGYGLIVASLIAAAALATTSLQRIVAEQPHLLDEYELRLRSRAFIAAYMILAVLISSATLYAGVAADGGGWLPTTFSEFNGLFWGAILYSIMLPVLCLAWQTPAEENDED